jgi:hypothetical protein
MTAAEELALQIFEINEAVRNSAIEAGEEDDVGGEVTADEILAGVEKAGLYVTEQIIDNLTDSEPDDPMLESYSNAFCDWMNQYVYVPIAETQIDLMIDEGIVEVKGVAEDGEFTYGLTAKGHAEHRKRNPGLDSGLQTK